MNILNSSVYNPLLVDTIPAWLSEDSTGATPYIVGNGIVPMGTAEFYQIILRKNVGLFIGYRMSDKGHQLTHGELYENLLKMRDLPHATHPYSGRPFGLGVELVEVYNLLLSDTTFTTAQHGEVVTVDDTDYQVLDMGQLTTRTIEQETNTAPLESALHLFQDMVKNVDLVQMYTSLPTIFKQENSKHTPLEKYRVFNVNEFILPALTYRG